MKKVSKSIILIVVVIIVGLFGAAQLYAYSQTHERTCTVSEKYVKNSGQNSKYLIVCGDETYKIEDDFIILKFNSSDMYAKIKVGNTYKLKTKGMRIQLLSEYENINEVIE